MPWHFWVVLAASIGAVYGLPRLFKGGRNAAHEEERELITVKLFDGPKDGTVQQVEADNQPHFFIQPYLPVDEDGMPKEENIVSQQADRVFFKPSFAFYQAITDEDYFYVRDIDENELESLKLGKMPLIEPRTSGDE